MLHGCEDNSDTVTEPRLLLHPLHGAHLGRLGPVQACLAVWLLAGRLKGSRWQQAAVLHNQQGQVRHSLKSKRQRRRSLAQC